MSCRSVRRRSYGGSSDGLSGAGHMGGEALSGHLLWRPICQFIDMARWVMKLHKGWTTFLLLYVTDYEGSYVSLST